VGIKKVHLGVQRHRYDELRSHSIPFSTYHGHELLDEPLWEGLDPLVLEARSTSLQAVAAGQYQGESVAFTIARLFP
jgi:hypothetical protein